MDHERGVWVAICHKKPYRLLEALGRMDVNLVTQGMTRALIEAVVVAACPQDGDASLNALSQALRQETGQHDDAEHIIAQLAEAVRDEDFNTLHEAVARVRHDAPDTSRSALRQRLINHLDWHSTLASRSPQIIPPLSPLFLGDASNAS